MYINFKPPLVAASLKALSNLATVSTGDDDDDDDCILGGGLSVGMEVLIISY